MKLYYYLRMILRAIFSQLPILFLTFVIFPFGLSFFQSTSMGSMFEPTIEDPNIEVHVVDQDGSERSQIMMETIESDSFAPVFDFKEDPVDAEYLVEIPEGFGNGIENNQLLPIEIEGKNAASRNSGRILQSVFSSLTEELAKATYMENVFTGTILSDQELAAVQAEITAIQEADLIVEETFTSETMLSSRQYFSVVIISYILLMFISTNVSAEGMTESIGFEKRWRAAPVTKLESWILEVVGNVLQTFMFLVAYFVVWRIVGGIFTENPFYILLIALLHAIVASLINTFITHTFSQTVGKLVVNAALFFVLVFGGMLGPLERTTDMAIFEKLNSQTVSYFITNPYWNLMKGNNWQGISEMVLQLALLIGALVVMNLLSLKFGKKVSV
ncbi:ABC transporter permease [Jeotgalibaca caeni]|uniref:ABC transporter permease n=1 Tax=Jeotgalibaca caeni TaxID=3028623 RepID=UPI00237DBE9B|nr:ABC transporter permease [Jeotgalibaca caeni]MDE1548434.1 ABC transporter permease [Jeotgalibaca caeni]